MSVSLFVELRRPLLPLEVASGTATALQELLALEHTPVVHADFDVTDTIGDVHAEVVSITSRRLLVSLQGHEEQVCVSPLIIPYRSQQSDGAYLFADRNYVSVAWQHQRTPLSCAIVAAVALAIARTQGAIIEDNAGFFTFDTCPSAENFCHSLRLTTRYSEVVAASEDLYHRMPKSIEVTEWLKGTTRPVQ